MKMRAHMFDQRFFSFSSDKITIFTDPVTKCYNLVTVGQKIIFSKPQLLIYNEGVLHHTLVGELKSVMSSFINKYYRENKKVIIFYSDDTALFFPCDSCKLERVDLGNIYQFSIDDNPVTMVGLDFQIITRLS